MTNMWVYDLDKNPKGGYRKAKELFPWVDWTKHNEYPISHIIIHRTKLPARLIWAEIMAGTDEQLLPFLRLFVDYHPVNFSVPEEIAEQCLNEFALEMFSRPGEFDKVLNEQYRWDGRPYYIAFRNGYNAKESKQNG